MRTLQGRRVKVRREHHKESPVLTQDSYVKSGLLKPDALSPLSLPSFVDVSTPPRRNVDVVCLRLLSKGF